MLARGGCHVFTLPVLPFLAHTAGGIGVCPRQGRVHYAKVTLGRSAVSDEADQDGAASSAGIQLEAAFDVLLWPPQAKFDAIIGIDFLARHQALVDISGCKLRLIAPAGEAVNAELRLES